jgi:hypothetical protein
MRNFLATFMLISLWVVSSAGAQSLDGVPIGSTVPSTGKFTNLEATTQITLGTETATSFDDIDSKKVQSNATDSTAGFLKDELQAGTNVTISEVDVGGNKKLSIAMGDKLTTKGDVLYHDGSSETRLGVGASGQFLTSDTGGNLIWANPSEGDQLFNSNVLLNTYRTAENGSRPVLKIIDGTVDAFGDASGVDATASTNELFDSSAATYSPTGTGTVPLVGFNGTNSYFDRGDPLTGIVDGKTGTLSFLIRPITLGNNAILTNTTNRFFVRQFGSNLDINMKNAGGNTLLLNFGAQNVLEVGKLVHIFVSWDTGNNKAQVYVDGVDKMFLPAAIVNENIGYARPNWNVGSEVSAPVQIEGVLGQLWFSTEYVDPAVDISKFFNNGPVDLGPNGESPTGTSPVIFLNNSLATWGTNLGSGGNFSAVGTPTDAGSLVLGPLNDLIII